MGNQPAKLKKVKIGLVQMSMSGERKKNLEKAAVMIKKASMKGAKIICLPELFSTPYFPQDEHNEKKSHELSEEIPGDTTRIMSVIARELRVVIIVPIYEVGKDKKYYNSAVVIDANGDILSCYRKMHIPHDPYFWEKNYFEEGNYGFRVIQTRYGTIAPMICFDQWFPEAARISSLQGADILFYPTAIGWIRGLKTRDDWHDAWETVQRAHAIANGVYVAAVNRVGMERRMNFWGQSFVCDSFGKIIKRGNKKKDQVIVVDIDLSHNKIVQEGWGFFRNRRPASYDVLSQV